MAPEGAQARELTRALSEAAVCTHSCPLLPTCLGVALGFPLQPHTPCPVAQGLRQLAWGTPLSEAQDKRGVEPSCP